MDAVAISPADILRAPELDVVPYAHRVEALAARLSLDLSATVFALNVIPVCLDRDRHAPVRRAMAALIARTMPEARAALPGLVDRHLAPMARTGPVDMMGQVVHPMVSELLSLVIGVGLDVSDKLYLSRVFSQGLGPARRRTMEGELRAVLTSLRAALPEADELEIGLRLSLLILGRDSLAGTLALSMHELFAGERPFAAMTPPEVPPRTGVPYIDRMAPAATRFAGSRMAEGETLRAWLRDYETDGDPRERLAFFGAGAHLCLGRPLSLDLWRAVAAALPRLPGRPCNVEMTMQQNDVFAIPETYRIEVLAR